jgi:hypothetical protein
LIVVFDSCVWISAIQFGGAPLDALDRATGQFQIALCIPMLAEIRFVLKAKFNWLDRSIDELLDEYAPDIMMVPVRGSVSGICRDPKDDMVLECAQRAGAECIVSGDKDLLTLKKYQSIRILTPRAFLNEHDKIVGS